MAKTVLNHISCGSEKDKTLVFLHGFMGSGKSMASLMMPLSERYHCIAFDLPGHGKSLFTKIDPDEKLNTMEDVARLVLRDLDALGIDHFSLYGYSMGGRIAQNIVILVPCNVYKFG